MILWVDVTKLQLPKRPVGYRVVITASGSTYRLTVVEQRHMKEGSVETTIVKVERKRKLPKKLLSLLVRWQ